MITRRFTCLWPTNILSAEIPHFKMTWPTSHNAIFSSVKIGTLLRSDFRRRQAYSGKVSSQMHQLSHHPSREANAIFSRRIDVYVTQMSSHYFQDNEGQAMELMVVWWYGSSHRSDRRTSTPFHLQLLPTRNQHRSTNKFAP